MLLLLPSALRTYGRSAAMHTYHCSSLRRCAPAVGVPRCTRTTAPPLGAQVRRASGSQDGAQLRKCSALSGLAVEPTGGQQRIDDRISTAEAAIELGGVVRSAARKYPFAVRIAIGAGQSAALVEPRE